MGGERDDVGIRDRVRIRAARDEPEMKEVASIMGEVLRKRDDQKVKDDARQRVRELVSRFPAYA